MAFKSWFKGSGGGDTTPRNEDGLTIEDLIVLERYGEAEERLKEALKLAPDDLHSHLKLAESFAGLGRGAAAADRYLFVAEEYAQDGFYDKGIALLAKAMKLNPTDENLRHKLHAFEQAKGLDNKRAAALEGVRQSRLPGGGAGTRMLQVQRAWHELATSALVKRMSVDQIRRFFAAAEFIRYDAGTDLCTRGAGEPTALWVVVTATVDAVLPAERGGGTELRSFGAGDILGESVLFARGVWPATYRVREAGLMFKLDRDGLEHGLAGNSDPMGFLDALRCDGNDADVGRMVAKLEGSR
jgi:hypothetical protein